MIIGLDISTSITGVTILDEDGSVVLNTFWDFRKCKTFLEKTLLAKEYVQSLWVYQPKAIVIEESLQKFKTGFSSAQTLAVLTKFNALISWFLYELYEIEPEYIGATSARKKSGIKVPKGAKAKDIVMEYMLTTQKWFTPEYTPKGNIKAQYYDMADSFVIARSKLS